MSMLSVIQTSIYPNVDIIHDWCSSRSALSEAVHHDCGKVSDTVCIQLESIQSKIKKMNKSAFNLTKMCAEFFATSRLKADQWHTTSSSLSLSGTAQSLMVERFGCHFSVISVLGQQIRPILWGLSVRSKLKLDRGQDVHCFLDESY